MANNDNFDISCPPNTFALIGDVIRINTSLAARQKQSEAHWMDFQLWKAHQQNKEDLERLYSKPYKPFDDKFKVGDKTISEQLEDIFCKTCKREK